MKVHLTDGQMLVAICFIILGSIILVWQLVRRLWDHACAVTFDEPPFDWAVECPELRRPWHVRRVS